MTLKGRVSPFGNPRIKGCSRLPAAYRRVPRPSSPLGTKASTECPYLALDPLYGRPVRPRAPRQRNTQDASTPLAQPSVTQEERGPPTRRNPGCQDRHLTHSANSPAAWE